MEAIVTRVESFEIASDVAHPANEAVTPLTIEQLMMVGGGECVVNNI